MKHLKIINPNFYSFKGDVFTADILGGVDTTLVERLICTLRITHKEYPPIRYTLDLYTDDHTEKLIRKICTAFELNLLEVSRSITNLTAELEEYRLQRMKIQTNDYQINTTFSIDQKNEALKYLKSKNLLKNISADLQKIGILGEEENALTLYLSMNSYSFHQPFSVLCLAKSGIGKSYLLQNLSECMPENSYSLHTQLSENALYYFDSEQINRKTLLIEDLDWTETMLRPLATLQSQGKLIKTRATKDKNGHLHSTTFEVKGKLCLVACAYSDKNYDQLSLPFLVLHLNHSHQQDIDIMTYQKQCKAGAVNKDQIQAIKNRLKTLTACLENLEIINPYATLIDLPEEVNHPRKSLLLLLNFIDVITYFHQHQRERITDEQTGEIFIKTHPQDIETAFKLLKHSLFRRADELSTSARGFYNYLKSTLRETKLKHFTALDIRTLKKIHPRTLNRYLQELVNYHYIQITGGNRYKGGYTYKISSLADDTAVNQNIEKQLQKSLENIHKAYNKEQTAEGKKSSTASVGETVGQKAVSNTLSPEKSKKTSRTTPKAKTNEQPLQNPT